MKPKPLDLDENKIKKWVKEDLSVKVYADIDRAISLTANKIKQRINSTIQGLIDKLREKQMNARVYQNDEFLDFYQGYEEGISDAVEEIKKWFPIIFEKERDKDG